MDINKYESLCKEQKNVSSFSLSSWFVNNIDRKSILGTVRFSFFETSFFLIFYLIPQ
jgi:hypothetical protein